MDFEWDLSKEFKNVEKHQVNFKRAVETFFDPSGIQMIDLKHSELEKRYFWIAQD